MSKPPAAAAMIKNGAAQRLQPKRLVDRMDRKQTVDSTPRNKDVWTDWGEWPLVAGKRSITALQYRSLNLAEEFAIEIAMSRSQSPRRYLTVNAWLSNICFTCLTQPRLTELNEYTRFVYFRGNCRLVCLVCDYNYGDHLLLSAVRPSTVCTFQWLTAGAKADSLKFNNNYYF